MSLFRLVMELVDALVISVTALMMFNEGMRWLIEWVQSWWCSPAAATDAAGLDTWDVIAEARRITETAARQGDTP